MRSLHTSSLLASIALLVLACEPESRCGIYEYDPVRHACACPDGSMWTEDFSECVPIDGGVRDAASDSSIDAWSADAPIPDDGGSMARADGDTTEDLRCDGGGILCGGACVDPSSTFEHCGGCNRSCRDPQWECLEGECRVVRPDAGIELDGEVPDGAGTCVSPSMVCGGTCIDVAVSDVHCGVCDRPCDQPEFPECRNGVCMARTDAGPS